MLLFYLMIFVRQRRIKVDAQQGEAVYHCISRTVNGEFLLGEKAREYFRRQMWLVAEFCGVQVLTYAILSNHFHILVHVPRKQEVSDSELLRRYERLYPRPTKYHSAKLIVLKAALEANSPEGKVWREKQLRQMGDISAFLKLLKQRFSTAFNHRHDRFGTLWAERFKSVLVEPGAALQAVAAYIDLNSVRAGLAKDPKDYRFCGYAEAIGGSRSAREGIAKIVGQPWSDASKNYRLILFGIGSRPVPSGARIDQSAFRKTVLANGALALSEVLRCRVSYFTRGAILGSKEFVGEMAQYAQGVVREATEITAFSNWLNLFAYRRPREI